jgi:PAS domain S-box-containing protein
MRIKNQINPILSGEKISPRVITRPPHIKNEQDLFPHLLHQKAFDNSFLPNIISIVSNGKIIAANRAAEKLLGYSARTLLLKNYNEIFDSSGGHFKRMLEQRRAAGHAIGDLTVIRKNGKRLPCQITSVIFIGDNHIGKAITTMVDRSQGIRQQTEIDLKKDRAAAAGLLFVLSESDATLTRLHKLEHKLDEEITAKEVSISASLVQQQLFKKEWKAETKLKAIQIARAISKAKKTERSDLGKELHDNVNQLLAASRIYMDLALKSSTNREDHISRSSEYTLTAIEEIRKLAKGLVNDAIKNVGLCIAIRKMTHDLMEAYPIKITCKMDDELDTPLSTKFKLDVFRIVQEQLNNIIKHANATRIRISFFQKETDNVLSVADNGKGFDVAENAEGIGIINIKSRAAAYKGNVDLISRPGKGCVLKITFPIEHSTGQNN